MMKNKLYIDFDGCITNSIKRITDLYNQDFRLYKGYKSIHWTDINSWGFEECNLASKAIIDNYFSQYRFFDDKLDFMENAKEVISTLNLSHNIYVCSIGSLLNLKYKREWLEKNLPCITEFIGVEIEKYDDKSHIDMSDAIFIDDCSNNLITCSAKEKILYGDIYPWNSDWQGVRCYNWYEVLNYVNKLS